MRVLVLLLLLPLLAAGDIEYDSRKTAAVLVAQGQPNLRVSKNGKRSEECARVEGERVYVLAL